MTQHVADNLTIQEVSVQVEMFLLWDAPTSQFVSYVPSIELSSYADDEQEAMDALTRLIPEMIAEMDERKTLIPFLLKLGWSLAAYPTPSFVPPRLTAEQLNMDWLRVEPVTISIPF